MRDELVRPLNESPFRSLGNDTFEKFVEDVFLPKKRESGEWRENTEKESTREIRLHLVSELGDERLSVADVASVRQWRRDPHRLREANYVGYLGRYSFSFQPPINDRLRVPVVFRPSMKSLHQ
jgi:hypothetical protein